MVELFFGQAGSTSLRIELGPGEATVHLQPGAGAHRLVFAANMTSFGLPDGLPIRLGSDVQVELRNASPRWVGPLLEHYVVTASQQYEETFVCPISDHQLQIIEQLRGGDELCFLLSFEAVLVHPHGDLRPVTTAQERASVSAATWKQQLERLGAAVAVEVLVPLPLDGSERRQAAERLREAKGYITDGKYGAAIAAARLALDFVCERTPATQVAPKRHDRTQEQRWRALLDDLYGLASGPHHDDSVTEDFRWSRADAVAVVAAVAGLLGRLPS